MTQLFSILLVWTLSMPAPALSQDKGSGYDELRAEVEALLEETDTPGVGVAIYDVKLGVWAEGVGVASKATGRPATSTTRFRVGSVSKSFVSLMALRMLALGELSLDTPITELAPEVTLRNPYASSDPVRLIHLLEHTSGLEDIHLAEYAAKSTTSTVLEGLEHYTRSRQVRWRPGQAFSYSNAGPTMVARAMENVTGRDFEALSHELLFEPLGMRATTWREPTTQMSAGHAGPLGREMPYAHIMLRPSGSLNTTPEDMARFLRMLVHNGQVDGHEFISPASLERMRWTHTTESARHGVKAGWGVGSKVSVHGTHVMFGHSGGIDGFGARYAYIPGQVGWVVMSNRQDSELNSRLEEIFTRRLLTPRDVSTLPSDRELDAPDVSQKYAGYYRASGARLNALRFLSDLLGVYEVKPSQRGVQISPVLGGDAQSLIAQHTPGAFRVDDEPLATVWFDDLGHYYDAGERHERVAIWWTWCKLIGLVLAMLLIASTVCALLGVAGWSVIKRRAMPSLRLVALLSTIAWSTVWWCGAMIGGGMSDDPLTALGTASVWSWSMCLGTLSYVTSVCVCGVTLVRKHKATRPHAVLYTYAWSVVVAGTCISIYMWAYGLVGIRLWSL